MRNGLEHGWGGKKQKQKNHQMVMRVPLISSANEMAPMFFFSVMNLLHMLCIYILFTCIIYLPFGSTLVCWFCRKTKWWRVCLVVCGPCGDGELQIQTHCHFSVNWEVDIGNNSLILFHQFEARAPPPSTLHSINHFLCSDFTLLPTFIILQLFSRFAPVRILARPMYLNGHLFDVFNTGIF